MLQPWAGTHKYCNGQLSAWFYWAWNANCEGMGDCLGAHIAHTKAALARGEKVLLVTGVGLHDDCDYEVSFRTYLKPLMDAFYGNPKVGQGAAARG